MTSRAWAALRAGAGVGALLALGDGLATVVPSSAQPVRARARQATPANSGRVRRAMRMETPRI
jgi:hypothetical protein